MSVISFSGLASGLDTSSWVSALTALKNAKIETLQEERSAAISLKDAVAGIKSYFTSFRNSLERLTDAKFGTDAMDLFVQNLANSSDPSKVTATATSSAARDTYEIDVKQVATNTKVNTAVRRTVTVTNTAAETTKLSLLGVKEGYVSLNDKEFQITNADTIGSVVDKMNDIGINAYYEEDKGRFTIATNIFESDDGITDLFDCLGLEFKTVSGEESKQLMTEGWVQLKPTTKLSEINANQGQLMINQNLVNVDLGVDATVQDFLDYINTNYGATGADASIDADGFISISGIDIQEVAGGSDLITKLGLVEKTDSVTSMTDGLAYTRTEAITLDTKLGDINTTFANYNLVLGTTPTGGATTALNANSTVEDLKNAIETFANVNGMTVSFNIDEDGMITIDGDIDKLYISGGIAEGLGLDIEKVNGTALTSSLLQYTHTLTANTSTTWGEIGITGTNLNYTVMDERGNVVAAGQSVGENTTIEAWFNSLKQYGIEGSISEGGVISIDGDGFISGNLATALGLGTVKSGEVISGTSVTSNALSGVITTTPTMTSSLGELGITSNQTLNIINDGNTTNLTFTTASKISDIAAAIEAAGGTFELEEDGAITIKGIESLTGSLVATFGLTGSATNGTSIYATGASYNTGSIVTESSKFSDYGVSVSGKTFDIFTATGDKVASNVTLSADATVSDLFAILNSYGLDTKITSNGELVISDGYISGALANALGITNSAYNTVVAEKTLVSKGLSITVSTTATMDTTLAELGLSGSYSLNVNYNGTTSGFNFGSSNTLADIRDKVASTGASFDLTDGFLSISDAEISGSLTSALGISKKAGSVQTKTTTEVEMTLKTRTITTTATATAVTTATAIITVTACATTTAITTQTVTATTTTTAIATQTVTATAVTTAIVSATVTSEATATVTWTTYQTRTDPVYHTTIEWVADESANTTVYETDTEAVYKDVLVEDGYWDYEYDWVEGEEGSEGYFEYTSEYVDGTEGYYKTTKTITTDATEGYWVTVATNPGTSTTTWVTYTECMEVSLSGSWVFNLGTNLTDTQSVHQAMQNVKAYDYGFGIGTSWTYSGDDTPRGHSVSIGMNSSLADAIDYLTSAYALKSISWSGTSVTIIVKDGVSATFDPGQGPYAFGSGSAVLTSKQTTTTSETTYETSYVTGTTGGVTYESEWVPPTDGSWVITGSEWISGSEGSDGYSICTGSTWIDTSYYEEVFDYWETVTIDTIVTEGSKAIEKTTKTTYTTVTLSIDVHTKTGTALKTETKTVTETRTSTTVTTKATTVVKTVTNVSEKTVTTSTTQTVVRTDTEITSDTQIRTVTHLHTSTYIEYVTNTRTFTDTSSLVYRSDQKTHGVVSTTFDASNTLLNKLGVSNGVVSLTNDDTGASKNIFTVGSNSTLADLIGALNLNGYDAKYEDGRVYLNTENNYTLGGVISGLSFASSTTSITYFSNSTSNVLDNRAEHVLQGTTTLGTFAKDGADRVLELTIDGTKYKQTFLASSTVNDAIDWLKAQGLTASFNNGTLQVSSPYHEFQIGGSLGEVLLGDNPTVSQTSGTGNYWTGDISEHTENVAINMNTKIADLGISTGGLKIQDNGSWINTAVYINENTTLADLRDMLAAYDINLSLGADNKITLTSDSDKYLADESSNFVSKLGLTNRTQNKVDIFDQTNSKSLTVVTTTTLSATTTLKELGFSSRTSMRIEVNGAMQTMGFTSDETIQDVIEALSAYGIDASINNGIFTAFSEANSFEMTGSLADKLNGNAPTYIATEKVVSYNTGDIKTDVEYTADNTTKLTELGVKTGYFNIERNGEIIGTMGIDENTTLQQLMNGLAPYNIGAELDANGVLTIKSVGDVVISDGTSDLVTKLGLDDQIRHCTYDGTTLVLEDEVNKVTEDTLLSYFDTAGNLAAGSLHFEVVSQDGKTLTTAVNIAADETFGSLMKKLERLGLDVKLEDGVLSYHNGLGSVNIVGGSSALVNNLEIQDADLETWMQNSVKIEIEQEEIRYDSIVNYADTNTKLSTLGIVTGEFSIGLNGQMVSISVDENDTLGALIARIGAQTGNKVTASITDNGNFKLEANDGIELVLGLSIDSTNLVTVFDLDDNGSNVITGNTSLYRASDQSKITEAGLFRLGNVTEGTFKIGNAYFTITADTTIASLVADINRNEDANATAYWDNINGRLQLTSKALGAAYVDVTSGTSNFTQVFGLTVEDNGAEKLATYNQKLGNNAILTINGTRIVATSNTITSDISRIEGLTVNIKDITAGEKVTIKVERNTQVLVDAVKETLENYNALIAELTNSVGMSGSLHGDVALNSIKNEMASILTASATNGTSLFRNLASVGISTESANSVLTSDIYSLHLDEERFRKALEESEAEVKQLLVGTVDAPGILTRVGNILDSALSASGYFATKTSAINRDIASFDKKINKITQQTEAYKALLERKFGNMENLYSSMQAAYSNLSMAQF